MLAGGDLGRDVDGCDLALAVPEFWLVRAGDGRQRSHQLAPGVLVDAPGLQRVASALVVDQWRGGAVGFAGKAAERGLETARVRLPDGPGVAKPAPL